MKFLLPVAFIILISGCRPGEVPFQISNDIDSIILKWVPDKREGICDLSLRMMPDRKLVVKGETNISNAKNEIINYLTESAIGYYDSLEIIPDPAEIDNPWGLVSISVCNIKKNPSHSSELVSQAIMGTPVKILKKDDSWRLVQTPDYYIGWSNDSGIEELDEKEMAKWRESDRLIYTAKSGDILSENDGSEVISDIVSGSIVNLITEQGSYYVIELPDARKGIIEKKYCQDFDRWCSETKPDPDKLITFAKSLRGSPYLWGGTSTKMSDCSGFLKTVYFTGGMILARDASQQFRYGKAVDISLSIDSLKPGDQIFFGHLNSSGKKVITHTGMYIGDTEVIHDSGMVRVNSLDSTRSNYSSYLGKTIMGARRIIGTSSGRGTENVALHNWYN
jgi:SH3-like domain-containing protein